MTAWPPQAPVAGVDGCPAGWLAVIVDASGPRHAAVTLLWTSSDLADLGAAAIAIDMPIGLLDVPAKGGRAADRAARSFLKARSRPGLPTSGRVFSAPSRAHLARLDAGFEGVNAGWPDSQRISLQAYHIAHRIARLDVAVAPDGPIWEAHPEVSFAALAGHALEPKATPQGLAQRADTLGSLGFDVDALAARLGQIKGRWGRDDLYDACILTWTAARIAARTHATLPDPPERDRVGHRMAIHI